MNHLVTPVPDGGSIMQGIQVAGPRPTLLLLVYMAYRWVNDDLFDPEIYQKTTGNKGTAGK